MESFLSDLLARALSPAAPAGGAVTFSIPADHPKAAELLELGSMLVTPGDANGRGGKIRALVRHIVGDDEFDQAMDEAKRRQAEAVAREAFARVKGAMTRPANQAQAVLGAVREGWLSSEDMPSEAFRELTNRAEEQVRTNEQHLPSASTNGPTDTQGGGA